MKGQIYIQEMNTLGNQAILCMYFFPFNTQGEAQVAAGGKL